MTQTEMEFRVSNDGRFSVFSIFEYRIIQNALLFAQRLFQQHIGSHTKTLPLFKLKLKGLLSSLTADALKRYEMDSRSASRAHS